MLNKLKFLITSVFIITLISNVASASSCQGAWGDDSVTYPVPTSFSQFSDSDSVGLNCHLSGSQCPVPQIEGTCDAANQGFMRCNIEVRDSSGSWTSIAQSTTGEHCDFDDDAGSNFATVSNFMIDHNDVTDIRCKAYALSYDATFDLCFVSTKGHDKRDDWWYNENTPAASNVVINPSGATTLDDLNCDYTFSDADNDSENLSAVQYKWYINDVDVGVNAATLGNNSTDVSDLVVCSVKVFDDVFVTGNEAFVNSTPVNVSDANETPGTLPQRREMGLEFEDKTEISYVMNNGNKVVEISNDDKLYLHNDNVGSSSLKTDDAGDIDSEIITMPFGSKKADTGDGSSKSFYTGKETDNTGLQYFGARYYDPTSGRFTQIDPIQRDSTSNYWYADANPMMYIDPDGRSTVTQAIKAWAKYADWWFKKREGLSDFKSSAKSFAISNMYSTGPGGPAVLGPIGVELLFPESNFDVAGNAIDIMDGVPDKILASKLSYSGLLFTARLMSKADDATAGGGEKMLKLYHGSNVPGLDELKTRLGAGVPLEGHAVESNVIFFTDSEEDAITWAKTMAKVHGGTPTVYTAEIPESALRDLGHNPESSFFPNGNQYQSKPSIPRISFKPTDSKKVGRKNGEPKNSGRYSSGDVDMPWDDYWPR